MDKRMRHDSETSPMNRVQEQVAAVRKLYSKIGEPLPADIIIDLYTHLGKILSAVEVPGHGEGSGKKREGA